MWMPKVIIKIEFYGTNKANSMVWLQTHIKAETTTSFIIRHSRIALLGELAKNLLAPNIF
jgi:hypothetical protein